MKRIGLLILLFGLCVIVSPQTKPAAVAPAPAKVAVDVVPIDKEPSHHLVFENEYVRVFSVEVAPHSETKYHQHDRDYVWVALGDSDVESVRVGEQAVHIQPKDGETQFSKAKFAHKAVNLSDKPFRNVTVELKKGTGELDARSTEVLQTDCHGGVCTESVISSPNVTCRRNISPRVVFQPFPEMASDLKTNSFGGGEPYQAGSVFDAGDKYLVIASVPAFLSREFRDRKGAIDLKIGDARWFEGRQRAVVTFTGHAGITYCLFNVEKKGPSRQKQGAQDDKAKGAAKK